MTAHPLDGVRVLDLTTFLSGPYATMVLCQLGAAVVKIEPPSGDPTRVGRPVPDTDFWYALHRGKRSVVLDLKRPEAVAAVNGLIVVTANVRHFRNFEGLSVEDWSTPR